MKKYLSFIPAAALILSTGFALTACDDDDDKKLDYPATYVTASDWTFSADAHNEICIGEIKTRSDNPQVDYNVTSDEVYVAIAKEPGKDDGYNVYKVLVTLPARTEPGMLTSKVLVEAVGGTDERVSKEVSINQYGAMPQVTPEMLTGNYTLTRFEELDADDGDKESYRNLRADLTFTADGKATIANSRQFDELRNGTYDYLLTSGNKLAFGYMEGNFTIIYRDASTLILEQVDMDGVRIDDYKQFVFTKK